MEDHGSSVAKADSGDAKSEPRAELSPGQHLQAINQAFFNGGGWVDPPTWDDYDEIGHAKWEEFAEIVGRDINAAIAAPALLDSLAAALAGVDAADAECPVRRPGPALDHCPRCGATDRQNCGRNVSALVALERAVRAAIANATGERS